MSGEGPRLDDECLRAYRRSRELYLVGRVDEAMELYRGIRRDHGCELFYEVDLPTEMRLVHPLGTVLGRATYADGLVAYQGVSVGSTVDGERPVFKGPCVLFPGARVIGNVTVGANVWVQSGVTIQTFSRWPVINIPDDRVVYSCSGAPGGFSFAPTKRSVMDQFFKDPS